MHKEILTAAQKKLLPLVSHFSTQFYLAGGTAIALQIGHRRSIDFDLFTRRKFSLEEMKKDIDRRGYKIQEVIFEDAEQFNGIISGVKMTFYRYDFDIEPSVDFEKTIKMPALLDLAAMKAYALGRRSKWKDYVDLYFIFKDRYKLDAVSERAKEIYKGLFNGKLFRQQLCYFEDIDYSEEVDFIGKPVGRGKIKEFLKETAAGKL